MAQEITLTAETGRPSGSRSARRLRHEGKIPGVVYGHGADPLPVAIDARELRHALNTEAGTNALLTLRVDGGEHLTMAKVLQKDPVRGNVIHVDFQIVRRDEAVSADVPIVLVGEAKEVTNGDGVVEQNLHSINVNATPTTIPTSIEVDISGLTIGEAIRVGDLRLPGGVTTDIDPEEPIVVGQPPQVSELDLIPEADAEALQELAEAEAAAAEEAEGEGGEGGESAAAEAPSTEE